MVPHYERFVAAFASPAACAAARPAEVVRLWSGLGYNRRALNLHRAARTVVADHGGALPRDDADLRALAGVGPYTARAVRSFAFGEDVAAVDTNAVRVLARCVRGAPLALTAATRLGDRLVPAGLSWEFNQTMFDLGATVCTGSRPDCGRCPLRRQCVWRRAGPRPTPGGRAPRRAPRAPSRVRTARGEGACSTRCGVAACGGRHWRTPAGGPGTGRGPSASRRRWWTRGSHGGPAGPIPSSGCARCSSRRGGPPSRSPSGSRRCARSRRRAAPGGGSGRHRRRSPSRSPRP